jgi:hypothetical protein
MRFTLMCACIAALLYSLTPVATLPGHVWAAEHGAAMFFVHWFWLAVAFVCGFSIFMTETKGPQS